VKDFTASPTPKQKQAWSILINQDVIRFFLFGGGAGGGKSWLGCEWLLFMSLTFADTRYFIARKEKSRLKDSTLKTFFKVCKLHGIIRDRDFVYNDQKSIITFHNGSEIMLIEVKKQPSDPDFEDLGSLEFTAGFGEEVSEWDFGAFDTLKSRIGRQNNDKYGITPKFYMTCNPKKNWVYHTFYKPWKEGTLAPEYCFLQSLVTDNPKVDSEYIRNLQEIKIKSKRERLLYGNWEYDDEDGSLCGYDAILDVFTNTHVNGSESYITADIARFGNDSTVIRLWKGLAAHDRIELAQSSITESVDKIRKLARDYNIPMSRVIVDEDGIGGGVKDLLKCKGFIANSRPVDAKDGDNFDSLKSQCAFKLADVINSGDIYDTITDPDIQERIQMELQQLKDKGKSDTKNGIISKDKMKENLQGKSPDDLDNYIMRMWFELTPRPIKNNVRIR
jgi:phage terminase large subunit